MSLSGSSHALHVCFSSAFPTLTSIPLRVTTLVPNITAPWQPRTAISWTADLSEVPKCFLSHGAITGKVTRSLSGIQVGWIQQQAAPQNGHGTEQMCLLKYADNISSSLNYKHALDDSEEEQFSRLFSVIKSVAFAVPRLLLISLNQEVHQRIMGYDFLKKERKGSRSIITGPAFSALTTLSRIESQDFFPASVHY